MPFDATRAAIAAMGTTLTPDLLGQVRALFDAAPTQVNLRKHGSLHCSVQKP